MNKEKDFDNIFDICLQRVLEGESVEACLVDYPEQAAELEPLLRTAADTGVAVDIKPRAEFRDRAAREFQEAIRQMPAGKKWWQGFVLWKTGWVAAVSAVVVLLLAGGGTMAAAQGSLPDSPLYAVKIATEDARLWLTGSEIGKAELYAEFADRRVQEIIAMAEKGDIAAAEKATDRMDGQLLAVASLIGPAEETNDMMMLSKPTAGTAEKGLTGVTSEGTEPSFLTASTTTATTTAATTTTTTTAAMTQTATPSTDTMPPRAVATPQPTVTVTAPAPTTVTVTVPQQRELLGSENDGGGTYAGELSEEEIANNKLRDKLAAQNAKNAQEIVDLLATAPDSVREALERALEVMNSGYWNAINNIDLSNQLLREAGGE